RSSARVGAVYTTRSRVGEPSGNRAVSIRARVGAAEIKPIFILAAPCCAALTRLRGFIMYSAQIKVWQKKLADLEDGPERDQVEAHIERLKAHADLAAIAGREAFYDASRPAANEVTFKGRPFIQVLKAKCLAAYENI